MLTTTKLSRGEVCVAILLEKFMDGQTDRFFLSVKFATSLLALFTWGYNNKHFTWIHGCQFYLGFFFQQFPYFTIRQNQNFGTGHSLRLFWHFITNGIDEYNGVFLIPSWDPTPHFYYKKEFSKNFDRNRKKFRSNSLLIVIVFVMIFEYRALLPDNFWCKSRV